MPKIYTGLAQGSDRWMNLRIGKVTASEAHRLFTPELKARTGDGPKTFLAEKLTEAYSGQMLPGFWGSYETDQGNIIEKIAIPYFELKYNCDVTKVAFVEHDNGRCGCSPDGLIGEDGGIEVKSPQGVHQIKYVLDGELPKDYAAQVHFSMYVTGRKWWKFLSFRRDYPSLVLHVERDEEIISKIEDTLTAFYKQFDAALERLKSID